MSIKKNIDWGLVLKKGIEYIISIDFKSIKGVKNWRYGVEQKLDALERQVEQLTEYIKERDSLK